ncbi:hypothetical protein BDK51DRAFT_34444, partial [Blyttiomyces helicus]
MTQSQVLQTITKINNDRDPVIRADAFDGLLACFRALDPTGHADDDDFEDDDEEDGAVVVELDSAAPTLQPQTKKVRSKFSPNIAKEVYTAFVRDLAIDVTATAALRCLSFCLYRPRLCPWSDEQLATLLRMLLDILSLGPVAEDPAPTSPSDPNDPLGAGSRSREDAVTLAAWCLAVSKVQRSVLDAMGGKMVAALVGALKGASSTLQGEVLSALANLFRQSPILCVSEGNAWLPTVYPLMFDMGANKKIIELMGVAGSAYLAHWNDPRAVTVKGEILIKAVQQNAGHPNALPAWGNLLIFVGPGLHRTELLNDLLKIVESRFNSTNPTNRIGAFSAWRRLIANFFRKGHLYHPKRVNLVLLPLWNGFKFEKSPTVEAECLITYTYLLLHLSRRPPLNDFMEATIMPAMKLVRNNVTMKEGVLAAIANFVSRQPASGVPDARVDAALLAVDGPASTLCDAISPTLLPSQWRPDHLKSLLDIVDMCGEVQGERAVSDALLRIWASILEHLRLKLTSSIEVGLVAIAQTLTILYKNVSRFD